MEKEKLAALGSRNKLKSMSESRKQQQQQLTSMIFEKKTELERLRLHYESLLKAQSDQQEFVDQFVLNKWILLQKMISLYLRQLWHQIYSTSITRHQFLQERSGPTYQWRPQRLLLDSQYPWHRSREKIGFFPLWRLQNVPTRTLKPLCTFKKIDVAINVIGFDFTWKIDMYHTY